MAVLTANDFANQMVAQARVLDPSFSGAIGTPERKLIDAVAQSLADNQVDLTGLSGALDIDSKYGSNLDQFTALFGMQRQQSAEATGFVQFSTSAAVLATVTIPTGVTLQASITGTNSTTNVQFITTSTGIIAQGHTASNYVTIQCVIAGSIGNVAANTITQMVGNPPPGVTSVTNPNPLTNGADQEDDNSYKVRFKNTWARNLAGTNDQYLALALAGPYTTKANVVGCQSRFQEYVQVPSYDDAGYLNGSPNAANTTFGTQNQWTSAISTIPYAKQIYTTTQQYMSNGQTGVAEFFYTPNVDFIFNYPPSMLGDALRNSAQTVTSGTNTFPFATLNLATNGAASFAPSGSAFVNGFVLAYTGKTASTLTGITSSGTGSITAGTPVYQIPTAAVAPNWTFSNVFNPSGTQSIPGLQALAPQNIVLTEYSYVSISSRNDIVHNVTNAVDIFVDGSNPTTTTEITLPNVLNTVFNTNSNSPWYYENFRRDGIPTKRPQLSNYITPLFQQPVVSLPSTIALNGYNYVLGTDYWLVHESADTLRYSVRSRDGIEWNRNSQDTNGHNIATASQPGTFPVVWLEVDNYQFDANVPTLQAAMEAEAQISTDVLVHSSTTRYFKLDVTVMYSPNNNPTVVNSAIATSLQQYFTQQYFGTVIQLSDLLEIIHETPGVDNVRWSNDLPIIPDLIRVYETDTNGNPLHGASVDRLLYGTTSPAVTEQQTLYVVGNPSGVTNGNADSFVLSWPSIMTTAAIPFFNTTTGLPVTASQIAAAITAVQPGSGIYHGITVTQDVRPTTNVTDPILSFTLTYGASGPAVVPTVTNTVTASTKAFDGDFFLNDHTLPSLPTGQITGDTLPGLIIRQRAQNTFLRPGLV